MAASKSITTEIIVVDNCSSDGSKDYFKETFSEVQFIWNKENIGFGRANNLALQQASGDHILFLNPDTILPENIFEICFQLFLANPVCGACGVRMTDGGGNFLPESKRRFPGLLSSVLKLFGSKISSYYDQRLSETETGETEVLSGAFMLLTRTAIKAVKGFDEDFFMYGEDIDLSYRIHMAGLKNYYLGAVTIIHFKGESTDKFSKKYFTDFYGAMQLFVKKHYSRLNSFFISPIIFIAGAFARMRVSTNLHKELVPKDVPPIYVLCNTLKKDSIGKIIKDVWPNSTYVFIDAEADKLEKVAAVVADKTFIPMSYLILCMPDISYSEAIFLTGKYQGIFYSLFHYAGSRSLAGSKGRDAAGNLFTNDLL